MLIVLMSCQYAVSQCTGFAVCDADVQVNISDIESENAIPIGIFEMSYDNCLEGGDEEIKGED